MRRLLLFLLFINPIRFLFASADEPLPVSSLTLGQSMDLAATQSEQLQTAKENQIQAEQRGKEALGAVLPNVHWLWGPIVAVTKPTSVRSVEQQLISPVRVSPATQPVFKGLKEFSSISAYKAQAREFELQLKYDKL